MQDKTQPYVEIAKTFAFEAAHLLPKVPPQHKCSRLHGHSYRFEIKLKGPINDQGWLRDFKDITDVVQPII